MEAEAGQHGEHVPAWSRHTYALVFHLFSAREY